MFLVNVLDYMLQLEPLFYIFGSFAFFSVSVAVRKLVLHKELN